MRTPDRDEATISNATDVLAKRVQSTSDPDVYAMVIDPGGRVFVTVHVREDGAVRLAGTSERPYSDERSVLSVRMAAITEARRMVAEQVDIRAERRAADLAAARVARAATKADDDDAWRATLAENSAREANARAYPEEG